MEGEEEVQANVCKVPPFGVVVPLFVYEPEEEAIHEVVLQHLSRGSLRVGRDQKLEQLQVAQAPLGEMDDARTSGVDLVERDHVLGDGAPRPRGHQSPLENVLDHLLLAKHHCELQGRKLCTSSGLAPQMSTMKSYMTWLPLAVTACMGK